MDGSAPWPRPDPHTHVPVWTSPEKLAAPALGNERASTPRVREHIDARTSTRLEILAVASLLGATAVLYLWNLGASGWANAYYSAAALAGAQDWSAWFFGSFDAGNALTVDKTPASLWVMALSVRLFGLSSWSVLVPQALMGVASVGVLYATVRRAGGPLAGLVAGATLALTPVAALMFRFNNPDALLVLLLVFGAYATVRGVEAGSTRWLMLAGVAVGFAFLAKMLQAFLVIPAFTAVVLIASPVAFTSRIRQVVAAAIAVIVSGGWYIALVQLWPADARPFIGGSQTNSIVELLFGYNGFGRITGDEVGRIGGGGGPFGDGAGLFRLFSGEVATEIAWLLPAALAAGVGLLWLQRRAPRTDALRAQAILWLGWLVVTGLVFSLMEGIFHEYYTVALAPPIGALIGLGVAAAWRHRANTRVSAIAVAVVLGSALWTVHMLSEVNGWNGWLMPVVVAGAAVAAGLTLAAAVARRSELRLPALGVALAVLLATPALASVATAAEPHTGAIPTAVPGAQLPGQAGFAGVALRLSRLFGGGGQRFSGPPQTGPFAGGFPATGGLPPIGRNGAGFFPGFGGRGGLGGLLDAAAPDPALVAALEDGADGYRWTAATTGSNNAAGLALSSETSVMAIGGFNGTDPAPTLAQFQSYVGDGLIHYYVGGANAAGFRGARGGSEDAGEIAAWVEANFPATTIGGVTLYDLTAPAD
jgi:4-amino-4-deoxy-L-arabinose transferase-like glycosyltransferase